ncbi:MAG: tetratricopeptide repeat protein [Chlorobi bacterium]|nr:tetratricopeptide repeat protein [Chlorobiota bacterium]
MKRVLAGVIFLWWFPVFSQDLETAARYAKSGETDKALALYETWFERRGRYNRQVYEGALKIYLQKGDYASAGRWIERHAAVVRLPSLDADRYHLARLRGDEAAAREILKRMRRAVEQQPARVGNLVYRLKNYHYLDEALLLLEAAASREETPYIYLQKGHIYAEQGKPELMAEAYAETLKLNENYFHYIQSFLSRYLTDDPENTYNRIFKQTLIRRLRESPRPAWLRILEWIYTREKNFRAAFAQLRALHMQGLARPEELADLAAKALNEGDPASAAVILDYAEKHASPSRPVYARLIWLRTRLESVQPSSDSADLIRIWKQRARSMPPGPWQDRVYELILDRLLNYRRNYAAARRLADSLARRSRNPLWREKKADALLWDRRPSAAAIEYTLLREDVHGGEIAYRALYKTALASFFEGDFDWAHRLLKTLKKATDKKIANDALRLDYLIVAHRRPGDTLQRDLRAFADVYYDYYTGRHHEALAKIRRLQDTLNASPLYDDLVYLEALLLIEAGDEAATGPLWKKLLEFERDKIYREEALYRLGILEARYGDPARAKAYLQRLITDYPQGYRFDEAREAFRRLSESKHALP